MMALGGPLVLPSSPDQVHCPARTRRALAVICASSGLSAEWTVHAGKRAASTKAAPSSSTRYLVTVCTTGSARCERAGNMSTTASASSRTPAAATSATSVQCASSRDVIAGSAFKRHFLHAPVRHLADEQDVLLAAVDRVGQPELLRQLAGRTELADDLAIELHLVDRRVLHAVFVAGVGDVEVLRRSAGHAHGERRADVAELRLERAFRVEHLDSLVAGVGDVDVALRIDGNRFHAVELALAGARRSPVLDEASVLVQLGHAVVRAHAVGDVDVAGAIPGDIRGAVEARSRNPGSGRTSGAAAAALTSTCAGASASARAAAFRRSGSRRRARRAAGRTRRHRAGSAGWSAATAFPAGCATGCAATTAAGTNRDRFRLAAEDERDTPFGVELHHLVGRGVDGPHVVQRIDAQPDRGVEAVHILAELADELAGRIEL